jgi:hypothetical protein
MRARLPFHCAGFTPCRKPRTVAASSTASMRPRTRLAVSGFFDQIGSRTLHNKPDVDRRNGQFAQNRVDVGGKGIAPLLPMLCVAPARFVSADELLGHLPESAPLGHGESLRLPLSGFAIERVYPLPALVPVLCSFSACLS